jgi:hypothetical protein
MTSCFMWAAVNYTHKNILKNYWQLERESLWNEKTVLSHYQTILRDEQASYKPLIQ